MSRIKPSKKLTKEVREIPSVKRINTPVSISLIGCYYEHIYYILWFDREHSIVPAG